MARTEICYLALLAGVMVAMNATHAVAETPGDLFRKQMAHLKAYCTDRVLPPGEATCDMLSLKNEDSLATPGGRLAHSIKIPFTVPPKTYSPGMTSDAYFKELCQEAGEFVFSVVTGVEGVMQLRPRNIATGQMLRHLYALEDPYGYRDWEARNPHSFFVKPNRYRFLETLPGNDQLSGKVIRYYGYDGRRIETMKKEVAPLPQSRYGYVWRGISRPRDREMGIAGGELIVVEINPLTVLGVKRGFARTGENEPAQLGIWWGRPTVCPGDSNSLYAVAQFVTKVLLPIEN